MMQTGFFDWQVRFKQLDEGGDPLPRLQKVVQWEQFRPLLEVVRDKERKSNAGRKPFDLVVMFKVLILQSLYNLSDEQAEYQIRDRLSFMRFLGLGLGDTVPDAKTIWLFREQLTEAGVIEKVFAQFEVFLCEQGFSARKGQIVDASIVPVPGSATVGRRIGRSRREKYRRIGVTTRSGKRIPMPAGPRRMVRATTAIRITLM